MSLETKSISRNNSYCSCVTKEEHDDNEIRKKQIIATIATGIMGTLLIAGGVGLIAWTAQTIHSSPPITLSEIKGAAGGIFFGSASVVLGTILGGVTIYSIKQRQKETVQPSVKK